MITSIIVDDEPYSCENLVSLLELYCPYVKVLDICYSASDGLKAVKDQAPTILFLDIEMPVMNGLEMLEKLPQANTSIIFTTSYDQYAIKAIRLSALDYLLKPIDHEELQVAVQKAVHKSNESLPQQVEMLLKQIKSPASIITRIAIPTMEGIQMISINDIISCTSNSNYTILTLKNKGKLTCSKTLKEIEELLNDFSFLRVHNSFVVNINEIEKYIRGDGGYLIMSDGLNIDVSRSRKEILLKKLSR